MNISSYNITDVGYHYIGLRVLAGMPPNARRDDQTRAISRNVLKYVSDRALRLMLPEPKGTFETVGEKICNELVHFKFAVSHRGAYELTDEGKNVLTLLRERKYVELRRIMSMVHLQTYDNLRGVVQRHLEIGSIWRPVVEASQLSRTDYIPNLLEPMFDGDARRVAEDIQFDIRGKSPKKLEDFLREKVLRRTLPGVTISEPLFRALGDRLVSLRLLNIMKASVHKCEFAKSYSPCVNASPPHNWYQELKVPLSGGEVFDIFLSEPDMKEPSAQAAFLTTLDESFSILPSYAGYFDLPDVRDFVCNSLPIPEAAFDEAVNYLLDLTPAPITLGLQYERISGRRKPLVRHRETTQIYNLIRRA